MRTRCYIDGFNLYYGSVKGTRLKWLDLEAVIRNVMPAGYQIDTVKYFTARVKGSTKSQRQGLYWRALRTNPNIQIILGLFTQHAVMRPLANTVPAQMEQVIKTEEKGSDVNLAVHLLRDGYRDFYDVAVVVTNDSDLKEALRIVKDELNKEVWILYPTGVQGEKRGIHPALKNVANQLRPIRPNALRNSQFPSTMSDGQGEFHRPLTW